MFFKKKSAWEQKHPRVHKVLARAFGGKSEADVALTQRRLGDPRGNSRIGLALSRRKSGQDTAILGTHGKDSYR